MPGPRVRAPTAHEYHCPRSSDSPAHSVPHLWALEGCAASMSRHGGSYHWLRRMSQTLGDCPTLKCPWHTAPAAAAPDRKSLCLPPGCPGSEDVWQGGAVEHATFTLHVVSPLLLPNPGIWARLSVTFPHPGPSRGWNGSNLGPFPLFLGD